MDCTTFDFNRMREVKLKHGRISMSVSSLPTFPMVWQRFLSCQHLAGSKSLASVATWISLVRTSDRMKKLGISNCQRGGQHSAGLNLAQVSILIGLAITGIVHHCDKHKKYDNKANEGDDQHH